MRRAWIEMGYLEPHTLRWQRSLSVRRAWIEITYTVAEKLDRPVALREESVD